MARRRNPITPFTAQNPFSLYMDMFSAGLQMAELFTSSVQVIGHRSEMIARAARGEIPMNHKEFTSMWMEKLLAGNESFAAAIKHMSASGSKATAVHGFMNAMKPYSKRATANAKRLGA